MKIHFIIASHGCLAEGMLSAVKMIAGTFENVDAFGLDTYATPQNVNDEVEKIIKQFPNDTFIILCDITCGSIHNQLVQLCANENISVVSGINLSLVLALVLADPNSLDKEGIKKLVEEAKENIAFFDKDTIIQSNIEEDELW